MNGLIKITEKDGKQLVSARELHKFLEAGSDVGTWFKNQAVKAMLEENEDFTQIVGESTGGRPSIDYALNISSAKEISMLNGGEKGKQARKYFIECEKIAKDMLEINPKVPKTFRQALLLAAEQQEIIELQLAQIEVMKPKELFFDQVTGSKDCFDMADVAKVCDLGAGRNTLFQFLRDSKILRENNTPYQQYVDNGCFRVIESKFNKPDGSVNISLKTVVYQKGIDFIIKKYKNR
jgi:anti-repressor protein